jgi:hypothetical protein
MNAILGDQPHAVRLMLAHRASDTPGTLAAMLCCPGTSRTALMFAAELGSVEMLRLLLDDPRVDAEAMLLQTDGSGQTALMHAIVTTSDGVGVLRCMLGHRAARPAAMLAARDAKGWTALRHQVENLFDDCRPILFILHRTETVTRAAGGEGKGIPGIRPSPAELGFLMERMHMVLDEDVPIPGRDECVHFMLALGALSPPSPVVSRIVRELYRRQLRLTREKDRLTREIERLRRAPHLIDAVVGLAHHYTGQKRQPFHPVFESLNKMDALQKM